MAEADDKELDGWYLLTGKFTGNVSLTVQGEAHIILADGCEWAVDNIILGEKDVLNIYAQSTGESAGKLTVKGNIGGKNGEAGQEGTRGQDRDSVVGGPGGKGGDGDNGGNNGKIVINGGIIVADRIGGGNGGNGGSILIKGGIVTIKSLGYGAGGSGGDGIRADQDGDYGVIGEKITVFYFGTESEWNASELPSSKANVYFYSEIKPAQRGNYWHFAEDGVTPVIWTQENI